MPDLRSPIPRPGLRLAVRLLLSGLFVVVLSGTAVAGGIELAGHDVIKGIPTFAAPERPVLDKPVAAGAPQTILLTGLDHRYADGKGAKSRSDTMMLLRLDPKAKATTILSLPRDLRAVIPGQGTAPQKLNGAWAFGGARLLTKTIRTSLLGSPADPFRINDVVSIRFDAFSKAVNELGCLYTDIDRQYYVPPGAGYAQIDQPSGYQRLCGEAALAYVRFRHQDSDLIREARQANFLTESRTQVDMGDALTGGLIGAIKPFVQTNVRSSRQLLGIARLLVNVVGNPTKHVTLGTTFATDGSGDVLTTPADLAKAREEFLHPKASRVAKPKTTTTKRSTKKGGAKAKAKTSPAALPPTMVADALGAAQAAGVVRSGSGTLPLYVPTARISRGAYRVEMSHGYSIVDGKRRPKWPSYRVVVSTGLNGQYYGIEGTTWASPPLLQLATGSVRLNGRTWRVQYDGTRIRRLFWSSPSGTYWISNTLTNDLTPREMYALARTFARREGTAAATTPAAAPATPAAPAAVAPAAVAPAG